MFIGQANTKIDAKSGELTDPATRDIIGKQLQAFAAFVAAHKRAILPSGEARRPLAFALLRAGSWTRRRLRIQGLAHNLDGAVRGSDIASPARAKGRQ